MDDECADFTINRPGLYFFGKTSLTSFPAILENEVPVQIACGCEHSVIVTQSGKTFVGGDNTHGQLGLGAEVTTTQELGPITALNSYDVVQVCCGDASTLFLTREGEVLACGENGHGQLGLGHHTNVFVPTKVPDVPPIKQVAAGAYNSVLLSRDGDVWVTGENFFGQLGLGHREERSSFVRVPDLLELGESVDCSNGHIALLTASQELLMVGSNSDGQLGTYMGSRAYTFQPLKMSSPVISVSCGSCQTVALTGDGTVWGWGYNSLGRLGVGHAATCGAPQEMLNLKGHSVSKLIAGNYNSAVITSEGELLVCGRGLQGALGRNRELLVPQLWPKLPSLRVTIAAFGLFYAVIYATVKEDDTCGQS